MSNANPSQPTSQPETAFQTDINVDQWRQDIQTFSDTTRQMLDAINNQLSNGLATPNSNPASVSSDTVPGPMPRTGNDAPKPDPDARPEATAHAADADETETRSNAAVDDDCDNLLAKLKQQLAEQLDQH